VENEELFGKSVWVLFDSARLAEGLEPSDKTAFAKRITELMGFAL
jgi:molecular chaperone HtpG